MPNPTFVLAELPGEHANQLGTIERLASAALSSGGRVLGKAHAAQVSCFEPGAAASSLVLVVWPSHEQGMEGARAMERWLPAVETGTPANLLVINGLPADGLPGLPDIPTVASVPVPPIAPRNALMVIRGSASDSARMDKYRDIILPMMKERGSYYEAFALQAGEVTAVAGRWDEQIFAISRWPTRRHAEDFWFAERYQTEAIPHRIGAGRFTVHVLEAAD